ncbi:MAG: electron transfer flavoprotein subunit beta/FixA family protein [Dehalococcoidales bacterium]|nr:electron transfer flavoprotein subunit beta/FixA family protein [Dehalococcoidales bacterium]
MNIIVCVKQVIDPEAPPASFKIDTEHNKADMHGAPPVIDPYGEYAVEAALRLKEANGGTITIMVMGVNLLREVVKKPLAMGADELILLEDEAFTKGDGWSTAQALALAIKKKGDYDLILCGREASDTNAGQTGLAIAEILGLSCINLARKIEVADSTLKVERVNLSGYDVIESSLPAVITISNEVGEPRYPTIKGIMAAKKIEPVIWKPNDIGLDAHASVKTKLHRLFQPVHEGKCEFAEGDTEEEMAVNLANKLRESKTI